MYYSSIVLNMCRQINLRTIAIFIVLGHQKAYVHPLQNPLQIKFITHLTGVKHWGKLFKHNLTHSQQSLHKIYFLVVFFKIMQGKSIA